MTTWNELLKNTERVTPNYRLTQAIKVSDLDIDYSINTKVISFHGMIHTTHGHYGVIAEFHGIDVTEGLTEDEILNGFLPKPSLADHDIKVYCNCPNYRFRFDIPNRKHNAGTGQPFGTYHKKTDRKPNNPRELPGVCYHLIEFLDYLHSQGFIH